MIMNEMKAEGNFKNKTSKKKNKKKRPLTP